MTRTLALACFAVAAFVHPAAAAPCDLPHQTIPSCLEPVLDKIQHLCFPPDPEAPYSC